jgi:hypothetical protein
MNPRHRRNAWFAIVLLVAGLAGCTDAITVWPVAGGAYDASVPHVPPVAGHWRVAGDDTDGPTLEVGHVPGDQASCRGGMVVYTESGNVTNVGDQTCFVDIDGSLVAEVRTVEPMARFYRQYLVRIEPDRIEVCTGLPVWVVLDELRKDSPVSYALDTLDYTVREQESGDLMVFISKPQPMREFLATALPEAAAACDRGANDFEWIAFERYEPDVEPGTEPAP